MSGSRRTGGLLAATTIVVALLPLLLPPLLRPPAVGAPPGGVDRPLLQVYEAGGLGGYARIRLILWSSGRAALMTPDLVLRETRVEPAAVAGLVRAAGTLFDLPDYLAGRCGDDVGSTYFAVHSPRGRKGVEVCGMRLERAMPGEHHAAALAQLRALWRRAAAVLPLEDARAEALPPFLPDEVVVQARPLDPEAPSLTGDPATQAQVRALAASVTRRWPESLVGHLSGEPARRAMDLALSARALAAREPERGRGDLFLLDGMAHRVAVQPALPGIAPLSSSRQAGRLGGRLPHHPLATAYNAPGAPYRVDGISHEHVAWWYRWTMPTYGWRLVKERRDTAPSPAVVQLWVRADRPRHGQDALVLFVFQPGRFQVRPTYVNDDVPEPRSDPVPGCAAPECAGARDATPAQMRTWYREHLAYLGWREVAPDTFWKGERELRLREEESDGRRFVTLDQRRLLAGAVRKRPP